MINLYDDSFLTDEIVDAATKAGIEYVSDEPVTHRDLSIMRQSVRVEIAAALEAGLAEKIRQSPHPITP